MTIQVHVENIFPTPIYSSILDFDFSSFDISLFDMKSSHTTDEYLLISDNEQILNHSSFFPLKNLIDTHMENFYYNFLQYDDNTYPSMSSSWLVQSKPNQQSTRHVHGNSIFSGVFYIRVPQYSGNLIFTLTTNDDRNITSIMEPQIKVENQYNKRVYQLQPENNMLVLFPSNLSHEVEINRSNEDRISLAFNYFLKGEYRSRAGKLKLS